VFIAFLVRARSWYSSFTSFVIVSDVVLGGVIAGAVVVAAATTWETALLQAGYTRAFPDL
jgi:hypothetical protein